MTTRTWEYKSDFARRYYGQGEAKAVLGFLDARGIDVPDAAQKRIMGCADLEQLEIWVRRAATVSTVDELFA